MSGFASRWAADDAAEWDDPDPGMYSVRVIDASAFVSAAGNETGRVMLKITAGAHAGRVLVQLMNFGNDVGAKRGKAALELYGVDVARIRDAGDRGFDVLTAEIGRIIGIAAEVTVKLNKGYVNIDVGRVLSGESDVPNQTEMFATAPVSGARNAIQDDDDVPY